MSVTIELPEEIEQQLEAQWGDLPRRTLKALAIETYRSGALTTEQVRRMLGLGTRMQVDALLNQGRVYLEYTDEEFAQDIETNSRF